MTAMMMLTGGDGNAAPRSINHEFATREGNETHVGERRTIAGIVAIIGPALNASLSDPSLFILFDRTSHMQDGFRFVDRGFSQAVLTGIVHPLTFVAILHYLRALRWRNFCRLQRCVYLCNVDWVSALRKNCGCGNQERDSNQRCPFHSALHAHC
jgi:hypothetical protein